jgi:DNA end-binding protein Ku
MRAIWKGAINFGLVNIPVRLYAATEKEGLDFHLLSAKDHSRIRYKRVSEATGKEVPADQIIKGYELESGEYITITDEELQDASPEKSSSIDIQEFVDEREISTLFFERPYYLEPDKSAGKPYLLLRDALAKSGKVGIAQFVLRNREHLCALKPQSEVLVLNAMRFPDEIRNPVELKIPSESKATAKEVDLALRLIEDMTGKFEPEKFKDTFAEDVKKMIDAKAKGETIKAPARPETTGKVVDLMAALQESLKKPKRRAA